MSRHDSMCERSDPDDSCRCSERKKHRLIGELGRQGCACGWTPPLGKSVMREFDKHLLEVRAAFQFSPRVEGVEYTPEAVESVRKQLIELRDGALEQQEFTWAVLLSHTLAYMAEYKEVLEHGRST